MLGDARVRSEGDLYALGIENLEALASDADAPFDLGADIRLIRVRICLNPFDISVHGRKGRHVVGIGRNEGIDGLGIKDRSVFDRVDASFKRQADAVRTVSMGGHFLAEQLRGLDDGARFIRKHLRAKARADAAVDAARGGELDHIRPARDLQADRAAAIFGAVARVACGVEILPQLVAVAERAIHVTGGAGDGIAGIHDARAGHLAVIDRIAQREHGAVSVAEIAHRGEPGVQRLHAVFPGIEGLRGRREGHVFQLGRDAARVGGEVDVGINQARQDIAVLQVDDADRLVFRRLIAGREGDDLAVGDDNRRLAKRRLARNGKHLAGLHVNGFSECGQSHREGESRAGSSAAEAGGNQRHGNTPGSCEVKVCIGVIRRARREKASP